MKKRSELASSVPSTRGHIVSGPNSPSPGGPYSQVVTVGHLVFSSGQRPENPASGSIPVNFEHQAEQVFSNLEDGLSRAGCDLSDIVKVNVYLADLKYFEEFNQVYRRHIGQPYPARTTVGCQLRGILVEVDAIAVRKENRRDGANPAGAEVGRG